MTDQRKLEKLFKQHYRQMYRLASDVRLVLRELFDTVKHYMQNGYVVDLKEMGKLSISVKSVCVDDPSEFRRDQHITGFKCNYTPHGQRYKPSDGALAGHIRRGLLDECEAEETTRSVKK